MNFDEMRARFHELGGKRDNILAVSVPLREARDTYVQQTDAKARTMADAIREAEQGLFDLDQERAALARALKGKTGEPPAPA